MNPERRAAAGMIVGAVLGCVLWLIAGLLYVEAAHGSEIPDRYDTQIRQAAERYLPGWDWRLLKAQYYQESKLNPQAESHVGAKGIAQFMPGTWDDIAPAVGAGKASPHVAGPAIKAGAYYMGKLRDEWSAPRPAADRYSLSAASYNAGLGSLLKAQRRCGGANLYSEIIECLPAVTGRHAKETRTYVSRIWRWWRLMLLGG